MPYDLTYNWNLINKTNKQRTKMAAQVDTLRLLAQPEPTENRTARGTNNKEIENKHKFFLKDALT